MIDFLSVSQREVSYSQETRRATIFWNSLSEIVSMSSSPVRLRKISFPVFTTSKDLRKLRARNSKSESEVSYGREGSAIWEDRMRWDFCFLR